MSWPDDRREYEQQIGVNELDGLIRDPEPLRTNLNRYVVWLEALGGKVVAGPIYVRAESVTMATRQIGNIPANTHSAVVWQVVEGKRVPVWHTSPKWAPSTEWSDVT